MYPRLTHWLLQVACAHSPIERTTALGPTNRPH